MTTLFVEVPFTATHQILIGDQLEPVHGHDFRCVAEIAVDDARDASAVEPAVHAAIAPLIRTHLTLVADREAGHPSAERIARFLWREIARQLEADGGARPRAVTLHEAPGCSATYSE